MPIYMLTALCKPCQLFLKVEMKKYAPKPDIAPKVQGKAPDVDCAGDPAFSLHWVNFIYLPHSFVQLNDSEFYGAA